MANLSLTLRCQRSCAFCFAPSGTGQAPLAEMSPAMYRAALSRLQEAGIDQVRLVGGEPTLHERFPEYVDDALSARLRVLVFSNGLMPEATARFLASRGDGRLAVLVNVSAPHGAPPAELDAQERTLAILGRKAYVSCTVQGPETALESLLDLIDRHGLERTVRLGLAQPRLDDQNAFVAAGQYTAVGLRIAEFAAAAAKRGASVEFDCGLVPCMFPPEFVDSSLCDRKRLGMACGPIPDILPDGTAVACFPLAPLARLELSRYADLGAVRRTFAETIRPWRETGILPQCASCEWRRKGRCLGGCVALAMRRLRTASRSEPRVRPTVWMSTSPSGAAQQPAAGPEALPGRGSSATRLVIPYVDQPVDFWDGLAEEFGTSIAEVYFPLPGGTTGSGRPAQPEAHLADFLRHSPFALAALLNPVVLPRPLEMVAPEIVETLRRLDGEHGVKGVTVTNLSLASRIRRELPHWQVTASILMGIERPDQAPMLAGIYDVLVPSGRVLRDRAALRELRRAFDGRIRLIVNEGCLAGCPWRTQHFFEMASESAHPRSLCGELLAAEPWMRLTGAWILPHHLFHYDGLYDELKLAGRVTLRDPQRYRRVLGAYASHTPLAPHEIGGGPAAPLTAIDIDADFMERVLHCGLRCDTCSFCKSYYERHGANPAPSPSAASA